MSVTISVNDSSSEGTEYVTFQSGHLTVTGHEKAAPSAACQHQSREAVSI